tara:strand:+ start:162 stop:1022 length:861 start_codon:yes stop_codon:yes gene_type:complete
VNKKKLISIVMPVFNASSWVSTAIKSVQEQSIQDWELWIIDDGSEDNSLEIIEPFLSDQRISLLRQKNAGPAIARNIGLEKATGEYLAFLDSDDYWMPDKLVQQLNFIDSHKECGLVHTDYRIFHEEPKVSKPFKQPGWFSRWSEEERLLVCDTIGTLTVLTYTELVKEVGGFREDLHGTEDWDLWIRISKDSKICKLNYETACYRIHPTGISQSSIQHFNELEKVYNYHIFESDVSRHIHFAAKAVINLRKAKLRFIEKSFWSSIQIGIDGLIHWFCAHTFSILK